MQKGLEAHMKNEYTIYRRTRIDNGKEYTYIGATKNFKSRKYSHEKNYPGCEIEILVIINCPKDVAEVIEASHISMDIGNGTNENISMMGNSSYPQPKEHRSNIKLGHRDSTILTYRGRYAQLLIDGTIIIHKTATACANYNGISPNMVSEHFHRPDGKPVLQDCLKNVTRIDEDIMMKFFKLV